MSEAASPTGGAARRGSRVVVVGSVNADLQVRVPRLAAHGETLLAEGGELWPGGKGANQAVAAAKLGAQVSMIGAIGSDGRAVHALAGLRDAGVDRSRVAVVNGFTGLAVICITEDGENVIYVLPGANATVTPAQIEAAADLLDDAALLLVQGELPRDATEYALRLALNRGVRVVVNLAPAVDLDPELLRAADPLVVNEHEAAYALGLLGLDPDTLCAEATTEDDADPAPADPTLADPAPTEPAPADPAPSDPAPVVTDPVARGMAWARALVDCGVCSALVTMAAEGVAVGGADGFLLHISTPRVPVVDSTGAGDALVGALITRLAEGDDLVRATMFAVRAAAFSVQEMGTQASYARLGDELPPLPDLRIPDVRRPE